MCNTEWFSSYEDMLKQGYYIEIPDNPSPYTLSLSRTLKHIKDSLSNNGYNAHALFDRLFFIC